MYGNISESFLNQVGSGMLKNKSVYGAVLCVESGDKSVSWAGGFGNLQKDNQYFIASVTKLYVSALILHLQSENKLKLEDKIKKYLSEHIVKGLHVLNGVDYSGEITIAHLLSNTSGIPDYFSYKQENGRKVEHDLFGGKDEAWPLDKILAIVKTMKPNFIPGQKGKAYYSDTNYELLGKIIENITGYDIADAFQKYMFEKLNLNNTYAYKDVTDEKPVKMYYKSNELHLPYYIASITAEGGLISTGEETLKMLKAFFDGTFFPVETLDELKKWNFVFYPAQFYFGIGLEKLWIPRIISPWKPIGEVLGFWGHSGAFAFYNPDTDLYFSGTVNQLSGFGHSAVLRAMVKIIKAVK